MQKVSLYGFLRLVSRALKATDEKRKLTSPGANREAWKYRHSPKIDRRFVRCKAANKCWCKNNERVKLTSSVMCWHCALVSSSRLAGAIFCRCLRDRCIPTPRLVCWCFADTHEFQSRFLLSVLIPKPRRSRIYVSLTKKAPRTERKHHRNYSNVP